MPTSSPPSTATRAFVFTERDYARIRALIHARAGIALADNRQEMVYSRLARRLRARGHTRFDAYLDDLESGADPAEWEAFTNALTTNLTAFFREAHHFPILAEHAKTSQARPYRVWCAASSTGEEPYSIAMTLCEAFGTLSPPVEIIASDIDTQVLDKGAAGIYAAERVASLARDRLKRFFLRGRGNQSGLVRIKPELGALVDFRRLNLLAADWPLSRSFDAIFCRNVMIYFDKPTQGRILSRFTRFLKSDGLLFAGHSENFTYVSDAFALRGKTVYVHASGRPANRPGT